MKPVEPGEKVRYKRVVRAKRRYKFNPQTNWSHVGSDPDELLGDDEFIRAEMPKRKRRYQGK